MFNKARSAGSRGANRSVPVLALLAASAAATLVPEPASAQYFGRNKVQYESFDFEVLKTRHFDVHFYPEEADAVLDAARMGERWYERFARLFQHDFEETKPVILYANHPDFQQTNTLTGFISEGTGGVTESLKNRVIMPLGDTYAATDHVLGHELVHAFQYDLAQSRAGGGLRGLYNLPLWLIEGMAEYLSVGREDPLTAMWLRDAVRRDDVPTIKQMTRERRFFPYRFGQAFWAYVGGAYGDEAVVHLFRASLRSGWDQALGDVLGTTSDSLSAEWKRALQDAYLPQIEGRMVPGEIGSVLLAPSSGAGRQNVAPSLSPDGRWIAFLSEKDLFSVDLYLADARTGKVVRKLASAASDPHFDALRFIDSSGAWSPDGRFLAFVVFADGDNGIVIVDTETGDVTERLSIPRVGAITGPAWSPDGRKIAFSGSQGGMTDLYVYDLDLGTTRQLTHDRHGDIQPSWSPDGTSLAFVSDRGPETDFERLTFSRPRIATLELASGEIRVLPIFGDVKHINPQYAPDGRSLYFVSDVDGFNDIYRLRLDTGEVYRVTNIATGVSGITALAPAMSVAREAGTLAFSVFDEFEFHIYTLDATFGDPLRVDDGVTTAATTALDRDPSTALVPGRIRPETDPARDLPGHEDDDRSRVADYLDDWSTGLVSEEEVARVEEYDGGLQLDYVGQPSFGVAADRFGTYVGGGVSAYFSDMLGDKTLGTAIQMNGGIKDIGGQVFFQNQKHRWNWGVNASHIPFRYTQGGVQYNGDGTTTTQLLNQRIFMSNASGVLAYPFSTTRRVELTGGFTRYAYDYEIETYLSDPLGGVLDRQTEDLASPDPLNLFQASVALVGDNSFFGFTSPVRGGRSRFEIGATTGTLDYLTLTFDFRKYFNPIGQTTLAVRGMHVGRYGGDIETSSTIQPFFLGYPTLVRGYSNSSFETRECVADAAGVSTCPVYSNLFGHRIAVANVEYRIPVFGTEQFGLFNIPFLPTELSLFADGGLAWDGTRGNPTLEFASSILDARPTPVFSAGLSARVNVLGFMVMEMYYAHPFQRPEKGGHFGFVIAPGW